MTIKLTDRAATHAKKYLGNEKGSIFLRVGITTTGCSGYMYQVSTADSKSENDIELDSKWNKNFNGQAKLSIFRGPTYRLQKERN